MSVPTAIVASLLAMTTEFDATSLIKLVLAGGLFGEHEDLVRLAQHDSLPSALDQPGLLPAGEDAAHRVQGGAGHLREQRKCRHMPRPNILVGWTGTSENFHKSAILAPIRDVDVGIT